MNLDKARDMVRKLLNTAEDNAATQGEIENALRFARKIMLQHNISESDIPRTETQIKDELESTEYDRQYVYSFSQGLTEWESTLVWSIVRLIGTINWYIDGKHVPKRDKHGIVRLNESGPDKGQAMLATRYAIYGPKQDVAEAIELIYEWQEIVVAMARLKFGGFVRKSGKSYAEGFCSAMYNAVTRIEREEDVQTKSDSSSRGLILLQGRQLMEARRARGVQWLENSCGVKLGKAKASRRGSSSFDASAYGEGREDGKRAGLSRKNGSGGSTGSAKLTG